MRPSVIVLALATVLAVFGAKLFDVRSHRLRFDGVYCAHDQRDVGGDLYLRFYPDGTVLSHIHGYGTREQEVLEMYRGGRWVEQGRYTLRGGSMSLSLEGYEHVLTPLPDDYNPLEPVPGPSPSKQTFYLSGELRFDRIKITSDYGFGEYKFVKVPLPHEA
jgi:hypothetical protein